jgi:hypothetical protein
VAPLPETALVRLRSATNAADAIVFTSQVRDVSPPWNRLEHRPEVAALAPWDLLFGYVAGQPGGVLFAAADRRWGSLVDKPVVLQGRMFNPRSDDEVVDDEQLAAAVHVRVGDVVPFHAYGPDQASTEGQPTGAQIALRVVGIVRDTEEYLFTPGVMVSPGVVEHYRSQMFVLPNAMVRLAPGAGGFAALQRDVNSLIKPGVPVLNLDSVDCRITTTLLVESSALWLLAVAVMLAGGLLVLQMLTRSVSLIGDDVRSLRALGLTRGDLIVGSVVGHATAIVIGASVGLLGAVALSPLFPVSVGRRVDPDPGLHADWTVIGIGLAVTVAVLALATLALKLVTLGRESRPVVNRPSSLTVWLQRIAPLSVSLGASAALERGPGARGTPVRPALVGAVVGVLGVVSALTINHGIEYALANPQLAGVTWATEVTPPSEDLTATSVSSALLEEVRHAAPDASTAVVRRDLVDVDGVGVAVFSVLDVADSAGRIGLVTLSGRAPQTPGEATIGPATTKLLHVRVGDRVRIADGVDLRLVGEALFPSDVHSEFDEGLWLVPAQLDAIVPPNAPTNPDEYVAVRFPAAGDQEAEAIVAAESNQPVGGDASLKAALNPIDHLIAALGGPSSALGQDVAPSNVPPELTNLENLAQLPIVLSIFLALLAVAALSFVLVTSNRSRRLEFAVLRAMGFGVRPARLVVYWQATAIAVVGLVAGVPLGILVGRWMWQEVTTRVPLVYVPPLDLALGVTHPVSRAGPRHELRDRSGCSVITFCARERPRPAQLGDKPT